MPSIAKSDKWFFRVTLSHDTVKMLWNNALSTVKLIDVDRCLIVGHVGEKTEKEHVHCIISLTKVLQKQSFDVRLKSIFNVSGADYSSKPWDGGMEHGAGSYLYHDTRATEIYVKGFTDEQRVKFRECNEQVKEVVEEAKSRASGRCVERTLEIIEKSNRKWLRREIIFQLLQDIRDDKMYECGDYNLHKYAEEIYMKQMSKTEWLKYAEYRVNSVLRQNDVEIFNVYE